MNWKNFLCVALLTGAVMAAAVGCQAASTVAATTAQTANQAPLVTQPTPSSIAPTSSKPAQPNGTMPLPPSTGNFTGRGPGAPTMNLADAATKLGVTVQQLSDALGNTPQGMPDFATAAQKLGVTEQALREALVVNSSNGTMPGGPNGSQPPNQTPNTSSK